MGSKFQVSNNFIENYLLYLIFNNIDLSNKDVLTKTHATFVQILQKNKGVGDVVNDFIDKPSYNPLTIMLRLRQ